ncbi:MAG TPA: hypothetical protein G4N92_06340 [Anaerolineae bacterium]|nr:hypothetical protein [Anaerolineae bacterium]
MVHKKIVIGATGHRLIINNQSVMMGIDKALNRICHEYPGHELVCYSSIAEGADRLIAQKVLATPGGQLFAVLPFDTEKYAKDFLSDESKQEFEIFMEKAVDVAVMPAANSREDSYLAAGKYVLNKCDVLIAVWDGNPPGGVGGTGQIVNFAREKKPLAWVHADKRKKEPKYSKNKINKQCIVIFENFPELTKFQ